MALLLSFRLVACTDRESKSHHALEGCSPNEEYVAFLVRKLVEYRDGPGREGRAPAAGNDDCDDDVVEDGVGEGGANDAGGFGVSIMDF